MVFETVSYYYRLVLSSQQSSCLSLLSSEIIDMCHLELKEAYLKHVNCEFSIINFKILSSIKNKIAAYYVAKSSFSLKIKCVCLCVFMCVCGCVCLCVCVHTSVWVCEYTCHSAHVETTEQLSGVNPCLPPRWDRVACFCCAVYYRLADLWTSGWLYCFPLPSCHGRSVVTTDAGCLIWLLVWVLGQEMSRRACAASSFTAPAISLTAATLHFNFVEVYWCINWKILSRSTFIYIQKLYNILFWY